MSAPLSANRYRRALAIAALVFAGEMVFSLPFHIARFFRPTFLDVFGLSNAALGDAFAVYGVTAMLAYFPGGPIADRFAARDLLITSLLATALGGLYLATVPPVAGLSLLFAWWGVTTIFLFWAALIRATREWGGDPSQGSAFGLLDGGRGLVAAGAGSLATWLLGDMLVDEVNALQQRHALQAVILFYVLMTVLAAWLVRLWLPRGHVDGEARAARRSLPGDIRAVMQQRTVWMQAVIVVCAYCGYKSLDYYGLYAVDVLGMHEVDAAAFVTGAAYLRPVGAVLAGLLADRFFAGGVIVWLFALLAGAVALLAALTPATTTSILLPANLLLSFFAVYALRGIYFALLQETRVKKEITGAAVGVISVVGFTPDIFFAPLAGRLLDAAPGWPGYRHLFLLMALISSVGLLVALLLARRSRGAS